MRNTIRILTQSLVLFALWSSTAFAQEDSLFNFKIVEREFGRDYGLEYTRVYEVNGYAFSEMMNQLELMLGKVPGIMDEKTSQNSEINREQDDLQLRGSFAGRSRNISLDPKDYGLRRSGQMIAVLNYALDYDWEIDVRENRYRLKISEFRFGDDFTSQDWVKSDGSFRTRSVYSNALQLLDKHFSEAFDHANYQSEEDEDW